MHSARGRGKRKRKVLVRLIFFIFLMGICNLFYEFSISVCKCDKFVCQSVGRKEDSWKIPLEIFSAAERSLIFFSFLLLKVSIT